MSCMKIGSAVLGTHKHNTRRALIMRRVRAMSEERKEANDTAIEAVDLPPPENSLPEVDVARVFADIEFER